jgi:hypothetical protein
MQQKPDDQAAEKGVAENVHVEEADIQQANLVYDGEEEPEIHLRTWIALAAMFLLNYVQVFALQGPPAVVSQPRLNETELM